MNKLSNQEYFELQNRRANAVMDQIQRVRKILNDIDVAINTEKANTSAIKTLVISAQIFIEASIDDLQAIRLSLITSTKTTTGVRTAREEVTR